MAKTSRTQDRARQRAGVFSLLPWHADRRKKWVEYVTHQLNGCSDVQQQPGLLGEAWRNLDCLGRAFDEIVTKGRLRKHTEWDFRRILSGLHPTYQEEGDGAGMGWDISATSKCPRRVGQLAGWLWTAILAGAVGTRLRRCAVCGMVHYVQADRENAYACCDACHEEARRRRNSNGWSPPARGAIKGVAGGVPLPEATTVSTALAAETYRRLREPQAEDGQT